MAIADGFSMLVMFFIAICLIVVILVFAIGLFDFLYSVFDRNDW